MYMSRSRVRSAFRWSLGAVALGLVVGLVVTAALGARLVRERAGSRAQVTRHFEYVLADNKIFVYDIDRANKLVGTIPLPPIGPVHGFVASPVTGMLYISYGGQGGSSGNGSLLAFDLL